MRPCISTNCTWTHERKRNIIYVVIYVPAKGAENGREEKAQILRGRKPWRQKGTGRARQGSTRSPQWTHGGIALCPKPRSYTTKLNKKVKQIALFSALSAKVANNEMIVVDNIAATEFKTKTMVEMLSAIGAGKKSLVVLDGPNAMVVKSLSNIAGVKVAYTNTLNTYDILNCNTIVFAQAAVEKLEEVYA